MRAEAAVAEVRVRVTEDVEPLGLVEDLLVEVGRTVEKPDSLARLDLLAAQGRVLGRGALEHRDRGGPADDLVGRRVRAGRLEQLPLVRMVEEGEHPVRDGVSGGLVARHRQHQHEEAELIVGQLVAVDLGADQLGDDVVPGAPAPLLGHGQAVAEDLGGRDHPVVVVRRGPLVVADHPVRPGEDLAPVLLRDAEQFADRLQRQLGRDVRDEVAGAGFQRRRHDALGALGEGLAQVADGPGREAAGDDAAQLGVLGRVDVEQDEPLHLDRLAGHALGESGSARCSPRTSRRRASWRPSRCRRAG